MRGTWIFDETTGKLIPKSEWHGRQAPKQRAEFPTPMVISDCIEIKSMADGRVYTSKATLRKSYRENGYVEVGNEEMKMPPPPEPDRKGIQEAIKTSFEKTGII